MSRMFAYAGSWQLFDEKMEKGIRVYEADSESGQLTEIERQFTEINADYVIISSKGNLLYCVDEKLNNPSEGKVYSFSIEENGLLSIINSQPTFSSLPCSLALSHDEKHLVVCNYSSENAVTKAGRDPDGKWRMQVYHDDGSLVLYPLNEDGSIGEALDVVNLQQNGLPQPHLHSVMLSPVNDVFVVCDRGSDRIYTVKMENDRLYLCNGRGYDTVAESGPRYSCFHPTKPFFYVNCENLPFISCYSYNEDGYINSVGDVDSLSVKYKNSSDSKQQSDIIISPDGRFLYGLTRGVDTVSVFRVNQKDGTLALIQCLKIKGKQPRGCGISSDGRYLYIACPQSESIEHYSIKENGHLEFAGINQNAGCAANITFMEK